MRVRDTTYPASAELGDIWEKTQISKGVLSFEVGKKLVNLAAKTPIHISDLEVKGDVQFILDGIGAGIFEKIPYHLRITDIHDEKHYLEGVINKPD
jgi:hypothetical protein